MTDIKCPYCGKKQTKKPWHTWNYNKFVKASEHECSCGKNFIFYVSIKNKTWTIPKRKINTPS